MEKRRVLYILMIIAILVGIFMVWKKDFNFDTLYANHKRVEISIKSGYELKDIKQFAKETIKEKTVVRPSTLFETSVVVEAKNISDDEISNLLAKINEKYNTDYEIKDLKKSSILDEMEIESISEKSDEEIATLISQIKEKYGYEYTREELEDTSLPVKEADIPKTNVFDLLKGFITPMAISGVIVAIYFGIRYKKLFEKAWIIKPVKLIFELVLNQLFILSVIAIARIPVSYYIPSLLITIWLLQLLSETFKSELELRKLETKKEK